MLPAMTESNNEVYHLKAATQTMNHVSFITCEDDVLALHQSSDSCTPHLSFTDVYWNAYWNEVIPSLWRCEIGTIRKYLLTDALKY